MKHRVNLSTVPAKRLESPNEQMVAVWTRRAERLSVRPVPAEAPQDTLTVLVVALGDERYGVELADVAEVLASVRITTVPGAIPVFAGVIQVHGEIRAVIDLKKLAGLEPAVTAGPARVILLRRQGRELGLKVDRAEAVRRVASESLQLTKDGSARHYLKGITGDSLMLLNTEALFAELGERN